MACPKAMEGLRLQARAAGARTFDPMKACRRGHLAERYTYNGLCVECVALRDKAKLGTHEGRSTAQRKASRAKNIAMAAELREEFAAKSRLPKPAYRALSAYFDTSEARTNSRNLNKLIRAVHAPAKAEPAPTVSQKLHRETHSWQSRLTQKRSASSNG